jgi:hypothetical protein
LRSDNAKEYTSSSFASPHSLLYPSSSLFSLPLKVFRCVCYVHNLGSGFGKLDPRATKCVFLGYSTTQKGYRCYSPVLRCYFTSVDVTFVESLPYFLATTSFSDSSLAPDVTSIPLPVPFLLEPTSTTPVLSPPPSLAPLQVYTRRPRPSAPAPPPSSLTSPDPVLPPASDSLPIALWKGTCSCTTQHPINQFVSTSSLSPSLSCFISHLSSISIPKTVHDALSHSSWRQAMELEMRALHQNGTWELVPLPPHKKTIGCEWVFMVKFNPDGSVERLKAWLVAKGYTQTYGIDYDETFSPVAKISSIHVLISLAANLDWPLFQLDVKNAFLHKDLHEVYMEQPPGFVAQGESQGRVSKLKKPLYGFKQSPRAWFAKFSEVVLKFSLQRCQTDHSVFHLNTSVGYIFLVVYVDDIVITGDDSGGIAQLKQFLRQQFHIKDLGKLRYFLGIEVARSRTSINLSQRNYSLDLLEETGLLGSRPVDVPMDPNKKLLKGDSELFEDLGRYPRLVGKLNYLTITRLDISYVVSVVSQFLEAPQISYWKTITRIIRYLKRASGLGILYRPNGHLRVEGFTDADWAGSPSDRRSTTGLRFQNVRFKNMQFEKVIFKDAIKRLAKS